MKRSSGPRKTANLSESIHQQLNMYALAASAAGVGVLALAQPCEAKIIYTKANHIIGLNQTYRLDLNHDGIADFVLTDFFSTFSMGMGFSAGSLNVSPKRSANEVWAEKPHCRSEVLCAAALPKGAKIGSKGSFRPDYPAGEVMASTTAEFGPHGGSWFNITRYLGLKFVIKGKTHFGWARLAVKVQDFRITATLTGYAYETIPGKAIIAGATKGPDDGEPTASVSTFTPKPATLGALAMGAPGLSIWRREESALQGN